MTSKRAKEQSPAVDYWSERLASREFKQALAATLEAELRHLASLTFGDVVEPQAVGAMIDDWKLSAFNRKQLTEVVLTAGDAVAERLRGSRHSGEDLLGPQLAREIEILLFDSGELSDSAEDFLSGLMQQDFTSQLFTEIIFTSIVSFNKKLNPIFGGFAMRAMEDQIRGFIRLFMPMVQTQAAAFAIDNHAALRDLARQTLSDATRRPISEHLREPSAKRKTAGEGLLRRGIDSDRLDGLVRECVRAGWDSIAATLRKRTLGELIYLDKHAKRWAAHVAELLLPFLAHSPVVALIAREAEEAAAHLQTASSTPKRTRRSPDDALSS